MEESEATSGGAGDQGSEPEPGGAREVGGSAEQCTWCGARVDREDGFRMAESPGERAAVFCRLEHVVPWALQGAHWMAGTPEEPSNVADGLTQCAHCGEPLGDVRVLLIRHRGEHRIPDAFCSVDHAAAWARAGGRWR